MASFCFYCKRPKRRPRFYLCGACWFRLPHETRELLWMRDTDARRRLARLYQELSQGRRLEEITPGLVTPSPLARSGSPQGEREVPHGDRETS